MHRLMVGAGRANLQGGREHSDDSRRSRVVINRVRGCNANLRQALKLAFIRLSFLVYYFYPELAN